MEPLPDAVKNYVRFAPVCRIATVRPSGEPHVIPVCPVFDGDSILYVDIGPKYASAEGLLAGGKVAVLLDEYHDDWGRLQAVLLKCEAKPVQGEEQERAWRMIREKFPQYSSVGWAPRLTLALRIYDWRQWGVLTPP